jgi:hypothetical protein
MQMVDVRNAGNGVGEVLRHVAQRQMRRRPLQQDGGAFAHHRIGGAQDDQRHQH